MDERPQTFATPEEPTVVTPIEIDPAQIVNAEQERENAKSTTTEWLDFGGCDLPCGVFELLDCDVGCF